MEQQKNVGHNQALLEACKTLGDYAEYVRCVREYMEDVETVQRIVEQLEV